MAYPISNGCKTLLIIGLLIVSTVLAVPTALAAPRPPGLIAFADQPSKGTLPPAIVNRLRQDLHQRTKLPLATLRVVEATTKTWPDGCLGLPKPDELCTQALIPGWRVVLSNGKQRWVYRIDRQARMRRLETR